jgi:predicted metal-dependent hydrolase
MEEADQFLRSHIDWVRERLGCVPEPVPFVDGAVIPIRGQQHRLRFLAPRRQGSPIRVAASATGLPALEVSARIEHCARRVADWLQAQARKDLDDCVTQHARKLGVRARRIALRDQTTRWGSCSVSGLLSFSWRLILAPPHVLDYVAAHEVAHLREMNHGPRFWKLVAQLVPELDSARRWLRHEGCELHRYGAGRVAQVPSVLTFHRGIA